MGVVATNRFHLYRLMKKGLRGNRPELPPLRRAEASSKKAVFIRQSKARASGDPPARPEKPAFPGSYLPPNTGINVGIPVDCLNWKLPLAPFNTPTTAKCAS